ncbi:MAG TPA: hypothetical protein VFW03_24655 [Gemmatimonadaceae bacterium]|nr:hypothetical protein [Gemmatimonadaceae bacterium]
MLDLQGSPVPLLGSGRMPAAGGIFGRGRAGDVSGRYAGGRTAIPRLRACGAALGMTWLLDSLALARK